MASASLLIISIPVLSEINILMYVHVLNPTDAYVYWRTCVHVEAREHPQLSFFRACLSPFFVTGSLTDSILSN